MKSTKIWIISVTNKNAYRKKCSAPKAKSTASRRFYRRRPTSLTFWSISSVRPTSKTSRSWKTRFRLLLHIWGAQSWRPLIGPHGLFLRTPESVRVSAKTWSFPQMQWTTTEHRSSLTMKEQAGCSSWGWKMTCPSVMRGDECRAQSRAEEKRRWSQGFLILSPDVSEIIDINTTLIFSFTLFYLFIKIILN